MTRLAIGLRECDQLDLAARYLATLHAVEQAFTLGDEQSLTSILAGVDPLDLAELANELRALERFARLLAEDRGGSIAAPTARGSAARAPDGESAPRPSAPVIPLDRWSRWC